MSDHNQIDEAAWFPSPGAPAQAAILAALEAYSRSRRALVGITGRSMPVVTTTLWRLKRKGLVRRGVAGLWEKSSSISEVRHVGKTAKGYQR